jgi:hypothetical protein
MMAQRGSSISSSEADAVTDRLCSPDARQATASKALAARVFERYGVCDDVCMTA